MGLLRRAHLRNREVVIKLDVVQQTTRNQVRGTAASVSLRVDHMVRANTLQNLAVSRGNSFRPDAFHTQVHKVCGNENRRLNRGTHTHYGRPKIVRTKLVERINIRGIGGDHVGQHTRPLLHQLRVLLNREDLLILHAQLSGNRGAKAPQANHEDGGVMCVSQWWAFLRGTCRGGDESA